MKGYVA